MGSYTDRPWFCPNREPDQIIGTDGIYMMRWCLLPKNRFFNIYIHHFLKDDDPRALHDHPWHSVSFLLRGVIREFHQKGNRVIQSAWPVYRSAKFAHRITLITEDAWTLFIVGPRVREWGFYCPNGWRHWKIYCDTTNSGKIGRGCD